jgi:pyrroloquinoline-quinone synthase
VGLDRAYVQSTEGILPGTRFAVEAYVNFVRDRPILEGIASSLTEMFSPDIIADRVRGMLANYSFITEDTLAYFTPRLTQAPQDVDFALRYVKAEAHSRAQQEAVLAALRFKCDVLWSQLDALYLAYVEPGSPARPFVPKADRRAWMSPGDHPAAGIAHRLPLRRVRQRYVILAPERLLLLTRRSRS